MNIFRRKKKRTPDGLSASEQREVLLDRSANARAVVIGGGHNGLICAAYLADAGYRVLVLEAGEETGGLIAERLFVGEFTAPIGAHYLTGLSPTVMRDLKLSHHGLQIVAKNLSVVCLDGEGRRACFGSDAWKAATGTNGLSESDVQAYAPFVDKLTRYGAAMALMADMTAPVLESSEPQDWRVWLQTLSGLPAEDVDELIRWCLSSVGDVLDEIFESDLLKAAISIDALTGSRFGPRSSGTMANLLWHWGLRLQSKDPISFVRGGPGALAAALQSSVEEKGVEIRVGARVDSIMMDENGAHGVRLEGGEAIKADLVVSSLNPKSTLLKLVGPAFLDTDQAGYLKRLNTEGCMAKMSLVLEALPDLRGLEETDYGQRILISNGVDEINRSSRSLKYSELPAELVIELMFPSVVDPALAPNGQHILSANVFYVPHSPNGGWTEVKEDLADRVLNAIAYAAPNIRDLIIDGDLLTPPEIESVMGTPGGHWHHTDLSLEHLGVLRTLPHIPHYHTPIAGLYLCGAGCHPGGGITGLPGLNAAREIIVHERALAEGGHG